MFKSKKIQNHYGVGKVLQEARYKTGLSLKMVAKHIGINQKYLAALEDDAWEKLPGQVYGKNFLKKYSHFLHLKTEKFKINFEQLAQPETPEEQDFKKRVNKWDFLNLPKISKIILFILIILLILSYIIWQINQITKPPIIILSYPITDLTTRENTLVIKGKTEAEVKIKINQEDILLNQDNTFEETFNLLAGLNTITLEGKKKYSRSRVITRQVVYEP